MKEILLTRGMIALVDDEDYDDLNQYKWCAVECHHTFYALRRIDKNKTLFMHNQILDTPEGYQGDHWDHNGLNNQKDNIRIVTQSQNNMNTFKKGGCSSIFKGVVWDKTRQKWASYITKDGCTYRLGRFDSEIDAALTYNNKAMELYGSFARLNLADKIKIKPMTDNSILPSKSYIGDAGLDVFNHNGDFMLWPEERMKVNLGFAMEIPTGFVTLIQEKSGMAFKNGVFTLGNVIDSTYRGECHAILYNTSKNPVEIKAFQKVAQMLIMPCYTGSEYEVVDTLSETSRGEGGFGSTGLEAK